MYLMYLPTHTYVDSGFWEKNKKKKRKVAEMEKSVGVWVFAFFDFVGLFSFAVGVFAAKVIKATAKYIFGFANSLFLSAGQNFFWLFETWKLRPENECKRTRGKYSGGSLFTLGTASLRLRYFEARRSSRIWEIRAIVDVRLILQKISRVCLHVTIWRYRFESANELMKWKVCNALLEFYIDAVL